MPWVEFEPTNPAFERAKIFSSLLRVATVTGFILSRVFVTKDAGLDRWVDLLDIH
jgi:hypothetical protein